MIFYYLLIRQYRMYTIRTECRCKNSKYHTKDFWKTFSIVSEISMLNICRFRKKIIFRNFFLTKSLNISFYKQKAIISRNCENSGFLCFYEISSSFGKAEYDTPTFGTPCILIHYYYVTFSVS